MFRFLAKRKYDKALSKVLAFGDIDRENWEKYKQLHVSGMILACMVDFGSHHDPGWACIQALEEVKSRREQYLVSMPFEYYADLVCTLKDKVSQLPQDYRDTAATMEQLAAKLEW